MHVQIRARNRCCAPGAAAAGPGVVAVGHWFRHDVAFRHERGILCAVLAGLHGLAASGEIPEAIKASFVIPA